MENKTGVITSDLMNSLTAMQRNELTEHFVYKKISARMKNNPNREILEKIAGDEIRHYRYIYGLTGKDVKPRSLVIFWYYILSVIFGLSFSLKLMEKGEDCAVNIYGRLSDEFSGFGEIRLDEQRHEKELLAMLKEERLEYAGSMVLGLNDALVELTGALAGFTFALQNSRLIALAGLITGFAASLSMASSGYLSSKEEAAGNGDKSPLKSALYTGSAYVVTVTVLIAPYFIFRNVYVSLAATLVLALMIILFYTFYITTAKGLPFTRRFVEMTVISLSIAVISFVAGMGLKMFLGVDV